MYKENQMLVNKVGVIHGRFQPLHNGHMEYLLAGKSRCDFLWVGITNPDPELTSYNYTNPTRSEPSHNPFTFYERFLMLRESLLEAGLKRHQFEIVPFPINDPHLIKYYVPMNSTFFITIYDEWGREKFRLFRSMGIEVDVMWERTPAEKPISGERVRQLLAAGGEWEHLVPPAVAKLVGELSLVAKVREYYQRK